MILEQYYLECLSQASYMIGDERTGRAVVVDPRRDIAVYLDAAAAHGVEIELVIETHFHADFLSGHLELAAATGAEIAFGPGAVTEFESRSLADGEVIGLGDVTLEIRHTPGHTPESISVVVFEHAGDETPYAVLTGDALFIGDVGRPDLLVSAGRTAAELAGMLYDSVHDQLLTLPDSTLVYPAHGAGSACGKNLSAETVSTIGEQRESNYAVRIADRDEFVRTITAGQPAAPAYFAFDAHLNRETRALLTTDSSPVSLDLSEVLAARARGATVIDARDAQTFARGHLRGSLNVGLDGRFAEYVGSIVAPDADIVLVTEPGREQEARMRLGRIGYDRVVGSLHDPAGAMASQPDHVHRASRLSVTQLNAARDEIDGLQVVDVREPGEHALGAIPGSVNIPVTGLAAGAGRSGLDPDQPVVVHCAGGYRSSLGASMLRTAGFRDVSDLLGGYDAWRDVDQAEGHV